MNLLHATLPDLGRAMGAGEISSEELTRAYLDRIDRYNGRVNAYLRVFADQAIATARRLDRERAEGRLRGRLHGIPLALKDIIDIEGEVTTAGGVLLPGTPAAADAEVTRRLREAGAVLLGKLNLHEYAWGGTTRNVHYGDGINPWKPGYSPGGSSGGSAAAVVAGLAAGTLGTDTLGSVRIPASYCGCVGLKTTYGLVSNRGVFPLAWSLDTVGPVVRSTEDARWMLEVIAGADEREPTSAGREFEGGAWEDAPSIRGMKLGLVKNDSLANDGSAEEREVTALVERAVERLASLGAEMVEIDLPEWNEARAVAMRLALPEATAVHETRLKEHPERIGEDVRQRLELGKLITGIDLAKAQRRAAEIRQRVREATRGVAALLFPTTATASHPFVPALALKTAKFTAPVNLMGWPAVSVPCGFTPGGLPVGLQVITPAFEEARALRIARAYEAASDWGGRGPEGFNGEED